MAFTYVNNNGRLLTVVVTSFAHPYAYIRLFLGGGKVALCTHRMVR